MKVSRHAKIIELISQYDIERHRKNWLNILIMPDSR